MKKYHRQIIVALVLIVCMLIFLNYQSQNIKNYIIPAQKTIQKIDNNYIIIRGAWLPQNNKEYAFFKKKDLNTAVISCDNQSHKCEEARATLGLVSKSKEYAFFVRNFEYEIKEWNSNYIKARHIGAGIVFDLIINLRNETAILIISDNQNNPTATAYVDTAILGN